jgi:hypothetical protein
MNEVVHGLLYDGLGEIVDDINVLLRKLEGKIREKYVTDKKFLFDIGIGINQCSGFVPFESEDGEGEE